MVLCEGNSPVTGGFPWQRPVTRSFDVFFILCLNKRLIKQSKRRWFETQSPSLWRHGNESARFLVHTSLGKLSIYVRDNNRAVRTAMWSVGIVILLSTGSILIFGYQEVEMSYWPNFRQWLHAEVVCMTTLVVPVTKIPSKWKLSHSVQRYISVPYTKTEINQCIASCVLYFQSW